MRLLAAGSWVAVRSKVADDPRFRGVDMDRRRKEIYLEVVEAIKDHAAVQAALSAAESQRELTDAMLRGVERSARAERVSWTAHNNAGDAAAVEVRGRMTRFGYTVVHSKHGAACCLTSCGKSSGASRPSMTRWRSS